MHRQVVYRIGLPLTAAFTATSFTYNNGKTPSNSPKQVFSWGSNEFGQLGQGHEHDISIPRAIPFDHQALFIASGGHSSAIVTKDGHGYTFGAGGSARLGHGDAIDTPNQSTPQFLQVPDTIVKIEIGEYHMAALTKNHCLYTWGRHGTPQLGHGNENQGFPNEVKELNGKVMDVACGRQQTIAITTDGHLYVWGIGHEGSLGLGGKTNVNRPKLLESLKNEFFTQVACGREYTLALTKDHKVFAWGANDYGQLGVAGAVRYQRTPTPIAALDDLKVVQIASGDYHSAALTATGDVYTWGNGRDGQLGQGTNNDCNVPRKLSELDGIKIIQVACGGGHTACIAEDGSLWVFGRGRSGQLGRGDQLESMAAPRNSPIQVKLPQKQVATQITCGSDHTIAM